MDNNSSDRYYIYLINLYNQLRYQVRNVCLQSQIILRVVWEEIVEIFTTLSRYDDDYNDNYNSNNNSNSNTSQKSSDPEVEIELRPIEKFEIVEKDDCQSHSDDNDKDK